MAGAVFTIHYLPGQAPTLDALCGRIGVSTPRQKLTAPAEVSFTMRVRDHRGRALTSGAMAFGLGPSEFLAFAPYERDAIAKAVGAVPEHQLVGYAMADEPVDRYCLRQVAETVIREFGGLVSLDRLPPHLLSSGEIVSITARDLEAFFGGRVRDADYVRENLHFVPVWRTWLAPAALIGAGALVQL